MAHCSLLVRVVASAGVLLLVARALEVGMKMMAPFPVGQQLRMWPSDRVVRNDTRSRIQCALYCRELSWCTSINLGPVRGDRTRECILNRLLTTLGTTTIPKANFKYYHAEVVTWSKLGCYYNSVTTAFDLLSDNFDKLIVSGDPAQMRDIVGGCGTLAWRLGYSVYGVKSRKECYGIGDGVDYAAEGPAPDPGSASDGCQNITSSNSGSIAVFRILGVGV